MSNSKRQIQRRHSGYDRGVVQVARRRSQNGVLGNVVCMEQDGRNWSRHACSSNIEPPWLDEKADENTRANEKRTRGMAAPVRLVSITLIFLLDSSFNFDFSQSRWYWNEVNHLLVGFGQTVCRPVGPKCESCLCKDICPTGPKEIANRKSKAARVKIEIAENDD